MTTSSFSSLSLKPELIENLSSLGFASMTPIQQESLPHVLKGRDVIAQGQTGSGKTVAFGLGLLQKLNVKRFRIQSLVLCPTRELADQVAKEIRRLARTTHNIKVLTLCGGMPFGPQIGSLEHGAHIIVGTPGRVEEHVRKGTLKLDNVETLVLDEADRMLDMGFQEALDNILGYVPDARQTLLFSATFPDQIQKIAARVMVDPAMIKVESTHSHASIEQKFYKVENYEHRLEALNLVLKRFAPETTVVFCNMKRDVDDVADYLASEGFSALALHGDLEQKQRDQVLVRFANKSASVLVATDVAARGLDIESLDAVVNFQLSRDPEVHVHRIGRTGRAGNKGIAISFFEEKEGHRVAQMPLDHDPLGDPIDLPDSKYLEEPAVKPSMATLQIDGGKKQKVRPGDIVGALTGAQGIPGDTIGKIQLFDNTAYVAVKKSVAKQALKKLSEGKLKGRSFRVRLIRG
ncbi:ATP-dependent RNA helicase DbpA [Reinekea marina]|uniref:ATP-dependent RNA helicase DbpA n=1 Tax=Reinekea marina TaxID=1310421 RepID=A0ABV7WX96_9GAMM|nr:ATP-dependent RNA helicase DbpA [Reinekea marina]MDN3649808.1 ATP-dependent RNA helicase DbpA [Reinekea marina]